MKGLTIAYVKQTCVEKEFFRREPADKHARGVHRRTVGKGKLRVDRVHVQICRTASQMQDEDPRRLLALSAKKRVLFRGGEQGSTKLTTTTSRSCAMYLG